MQNPTLRQLLSVCGISAVCAMAPQTALAFSVHELTIPLLHKAIEKHQVTCEGVVQKYLERIKKLNLDLSRGAPINAIVALNPQVFEDARKLDHVFSKTGKLIGPLHCVPTLLKDNIDSTDTPSTSGALALLGSQPQVDAFLVKRLRAEGAIILGKSTMDELAAGLSGQSSRSGRTGNAYDPSKSPGGSSAGSAAAVSANFSLVAIGSDNSGSLRIPASYNGLYTIRPSTGLISQSGIFPRGALDGVAGPMTRSVHDLAVMMDALAAIDPADPKTQAMKRPRSYLKFLKRDGLERKRIGILRSVGKADQFKSATPEMKALYEEIFSRFEKLGATVVRDVHLPDFNLDRTHNMAGEVEDIDRYLASFPSSRASYADICSSKRTQGPFLSEDGCLRHIRDTAKHDSSEYRGVLRIFETNRHYVELVLNDLKLDALIVPVDSFGSAGVDGRVEGINCMVASNAGLPGLALVGDYTREPQPMPVGVELIGRKYAEAELIEMAYAYEQGAVARRAPPDGGTGTRALAHYSILDLNRLFTRLGWESYTLSVKNGRPGEYTLRSFSEIVRSILMNHLME